MTRNQGPRRARSPRPGERWHSFVSDEEEEVPSTTETASSDRISSVPVPVRRGIPAFVPPYGSQYTSRPNPDLRPSDDSNDSGYGSQETPFPAMRPIPAMVPPYGRQYVPEAASRRERQQEQAPSSPQVQAGASREGPPSPEHNYTWEGQAADAPQVWEYLRSDRTYPSAPEPLPRPVWRTPRRASPQQETHERRVPRSPPPQGALRDMTGLLTSALLNQSPFNHNQRGPSIENDEFDARSDLSTDSLSSVSTFSSASTSSGLLQELVDDIHRQYDTHGGQRLGQIGRIMLYAPVLGYIEDLSDFEKALRSLHGEQLQDFMRFLLFDLEDGFGVLHRRFLRAARREDRRGVYAV